MTYEFTDRYGGARLPDDACDGQCEGLGVYPTHQDDPDTTDHERAEIERIKAESGPASDGYYFVRCPDCSGTGRTAT